MATPPVPLDVLSHFPTTSSLVSLIDIVCVFLSTPSPVASEFSAAITSLLASPDANPSPSSPSSAALSPKVVKAASRALLLYIPVAARAGSGPSALQSVASSAGLEPSSQQAFVEAVLRHMPAVRERILLSGSGAAAGEGGGGGGEAFGGTDALLKVNEIVGLSWTFGVTAATDTLAQCGRTYLQLKLALRESEGEGRREVLMEMDVKGLYNLLGEMERAKAVLSVVE